MCVIGPIKDSPHIWLATCWHACLMLSQFWANLMCCIKWLITCWHLVCLVVPTVGHDVGPMRNMVFGPTSSASDGPTKWPTKALAQQLIAIWVMSNKCSGIHTVRVPTCIEINL